MHIASSKFQAHCVENRWCFPVHECIVLCNLFFRLNLKSNSDRLTQLCGFERQPYPSPKNINKTGSFNVVSICTILVLEMGFYYSIYPILSVLAGYWYSTNCGYKMGLACKKPQNSGAVTPITTQASTAAPGYCPHGFFEVG